MFDSICVVGAGRVGEAAHARLAERANATLTGRELDVRGADLVLLCVPDRAIADVAQALPVGPWVAHVSGAMPLTTLDPHVRRFALHPLQTFQHGLGPGQFDGAWAAITAESDDAERAALDVADALGVRPFPLEDSERPAYHAAATMAASFLVTLQRAASDLMEASGAPPEALEPLMRRTIDNGFRPTGPHVRGDRETIDRHVGAIRARRPHLEPFYRTLSDATERLALR
jgi:predicted short-subunit dehydrogenase-like oxidoreductase (DUF2520 family)